MDMDVNKSYKTSARLSWLKHQTCVVAAARQKRKTGTFDSQNRATSSTLQSPIIDKIGPEISAQAGSGSDHQTMQQSSLVRSLSDCQSDRLRLKSHSSQSAGHLKVKNNGSAAGPQMHYSKMGGKPPLFLNCSKFQIKFNLTILFVL